jgi:hypothetical protein
VANRGRYVELLLRLVLTKRCSAMLPDHRELGEKDHVRGLESSEEVVFATTLDR